MTDELEGGTKEPIEETVEKLEGIAGELDQAKEDLKTANDAIDGNKKEIERLQKENRSQQDKLPQLEKNQQNAQEHVDDLLTHLEELVDLKIERIDPSGPVVQGGTAKYKATLDSLPKHTRLSWDTGGCPFTPEGETITVQTGAVGPGDYDISVKLEWVSPSKKSGRSVSKKPAESLKAGA
jgi:hypothetical protein